MDETQIKEALNDSHVLFLVNESEMYSDHNVITDDSSSGESSNESPAQQRYRT